ncbi:DUF2332 domain-containing protein [Naasia lichenicola]|uniref:DUF2332 domain-containing protein n=1 Tax=Naasia lichenicola TaxID=2565933 RepID=UPI00130E399F|nr:DUF2332 domain-containing protein [Naasia lichenicola]
MVIDQASAEQTSTRNESLTAERYRVFADVDALDLSPVYAELARRAADDPELLEIIDELPAMQRQVTFVFALARYLGAPFHQFEAFRDWVLEHRELVLETAVGRTMQTNDPSRLAPILPLLAQIRKPIALLEVGASAGLCLYPDRYSFKYGDHPAIHPADGPSPVVIECAVSDHFPAPPELPQIVWRAGIDLNPVDVRNPDDVAWLRALIWPDNERRSRTLDAAIELVAGETPMLVKGDLNDALPALIRQVPPEATLVIFHSAVLGYVEYEEVETFVNTVLALPCVWIASELDDVIPGIDSQAYGSDTAHEFSFVVAVDGVPVARSHPHGAWVAWDGDERPAHP